jgi:Tfp pilus assembly protein PilN
VRSAPVNLARRPFANLRPVRRVAAALWVIGGVLVVLAAVLYWRSLFGIEGGREKIAAVDRSIAAEERRLAAAEAALAGMDLHRQNVEAAYLDARIRERTFPWSGLFEHLADVLPRHVKLANLSPQVGDAGVARTARGRRSASLATGGRVYLQMRGTAADDASLTELLDRLFASPWFERPTMPIEHRDPARGGIDFDLQVSYLPTSPRKVPIRPREPTPSAASASLIGTLTGGSR